MQDIFIPNSLSFYKRYVPGSYADLTYDERMFYINLIKNSENRCCQDFSYTKFTEEYQEYDIQDNLHEFFSDMSEHINHIFSNVCDHFYDLFRECIERHCDDFYEDGYDQHISWIEYYEDDNSFSICMEYDQTSDYVEFDRIDFVDENKIFEYINEFIIERLEDKNYYLPALEYCSEYVQTFIKKYLNIR